MEVFASRSSVEALHHTLVGQDRNGTPCGMHGSYAVALHAPSHAFALQQTFEYNKVKKIIEAVSLSVRCCFASRHAIVHALLFARLPVWLQRPPALCDILAFLFCTGH